MCKPHCRICKNPMKQITFYRYPHTMNVGDMLTTPILQHFRPDINFSQVDEEQIRKLMFIGSVMRVLKHGDIVIGTGIMRETDEFPQAKYCTFHAVRGKLTRDIIIRGGGVVPEVYGDPAVLMPLMFNPKVEKTHKVGIIPHFVDYSLISEDFGDHLAGGKSWKLIDVFLPYPQFIEEMLSCDHIVSSSLHGLILAEAYGLSAEWVVLSDKVLGNGFKFKDYLTGTDREPQEPGIFPKLKKNVLKRQQDDLLKIIMSL